MSEPLRGAEATASYERLELILEAVLFAALDPVPVKELQAACASIEGIGRAEVEAALERLAEQYRDRAVELVRSAGGYRFRVRERFSAVVQAAQPERPARLSRAMLETLAIIAYRQPVTRAEIEEIRGVAVSTQIMRTLTERGWVHVVGHKEVPGRPALYATTRAFLDDLGLHRLDELPPLDALRELVDLPPDEALTDPASTGAAPSPGNPDDPSGDADREQPR
ncbi:Segregation and condensation protein B [Thioalkalivibrio nitratireducens DSM 14787]|uniref:Segregation and condensation protein B n=1 Tax=Thioalkalivibrio nitratireducens (strain DSM 14787 / UNIQEM 213 / ALEN2) TaxID=1255043 RepID=L0DVU3_THIND|nr:SMC-Scp complex subunit ScpB [Thioalkalivibrio nitratireducens]AGA33100.1 Segregation and condensation protein B [Thioalkalivibrio nitratireducens DSM 14787]